MKLRFFATALVAMIWQAGIAGHTSSEIYLHLQKFSSLKKVLYIAAHPDDENTRFLAWMSLGENAETAYLSLTRGGGGQNLIGNELSEDLGVLRTRELLAARSYDHSEQYFSRAVDFGFSKSAEETLQKWGKENILSDVVLMIRQFQPDVIITRFPPDERAGHGHHIASCILALEAFEKAADPNFLPDQVKQYGTWKTTSIYWNASNWWNKNLDKEAAGNPDYLIKDIGTYSSLLGQSYNEIGTIARSQHRCQGFGALLERGSNKEYFQYLAGSKLKQDFFEESKRTWGSADVEKAISDLVKNFNFRQTENNVTALVTIKAALDKLPDSSFKKSKTAQCNQLIADCLGLYVAITSDDYSLVQNDKTQLTLSVINRSSVPVTVKRVGHKSMNTLLPYNEVLNEKIEQENTLAITNPYWLRHDFTHIFTVDNQDDLLQPVSKPTFSYPVVLAVKGTVVELTLPVEYKWKDPSYGERSRETISTPDFSVNFPDKSVILRAGESKKITLNVHSFKADLQDTIILQVPSFWQISTMRIPIHIKNKHEESKVEITLTANDQSERGDVVLKNTQGETLYSFTEIKYDHIPTQVIFKKSKLECIRIDAKIKAGKVAYIKGVDDVVPQAIEQLGFSLEVFEVNDLPTLDLSKYETVVLGIRIYNVHPELKNYDDKLFDYVKNGGNLVMQYNTSGRGDDSVTYGGPLAFNLSRNRVTEEDAEVTFLAPDNPVMNYPNKITGADFSGWVQERGLYFAANWSKDFSPLLSWHDQNEEAQKGALIVAKYGKGRFVYTGISFFRELPNGVEGAYRLFANLLSYEPTGN